MRNNLKNETYERLFVQNSETSEFFFGMFGFFCV